MDLNETERAYAAFENRYRSAQHRFTKDIRMEAVRLRQHVDSLHLGYVKAKREAQARPSRGAEERCDRAARALMEAIAFCDTHLVWAALLC